jgi:hypothetical protein
VKNTGSFEIFISHATPDKKLARELEDLLSDVLGLEKQRIFRSSDGRSLEIGKPFNEQIVAAHQQARAVVALMTPNSLLRHWVLCEMAAAHFRKGQSLHIMTANGVSPECIPAPFNSLQTGDLGNERAIHNLCETLGKNLERRVKALPRDKTQQIVIAASRGEGADWRRVKPMLVVEKEAASPFRLGKILSESSLFAARSRVEYCGRDIINLTRSFRRLSQMQEEIFRWLRAGKERKFRIVIQVGAAGQPELNELMTLCCQEQRLTNKSYLRILKTDSVPQRILFVDATGEQCSNGYAVLSPAGFSELEAGCPQFVLRRQDGHVFDYYWTPYYMTRRNTKLCPVIFDSRDNYAK